MLRKSLFAFAVILLPAAVHAQVKVLRHPTYSKGRVAFSYLGDIWSAKENGTGVERLTVHRSRDIYPRFSPDGASIAFSSNRDGNYDVYVMPAAGGKPTQLTFHSADDNVLGWTPDGKKILFQSGRAKGAFPTVATLFLVSVDGGLEEPVPTDWGSGGSYSADGARLALTRHPASWSRKHYRGSYNADLWLMDVAAKKFTRLGDNDYKGNYLWPMYARGGEVYFVSDRLPNEKNIKFGGPEVMKSVNNIWKISERGGAPSQVTRHTSGNLFFPSISADGKTIVYEENFGLWKLDTSSGKSSEIRIEISSDLKENELELRTIQSEAEGYHLSPSTRRAAISTHGEIFTIATERGEVQRVTDSFWRDQNPSWSPDGKWIAFISDRSGREEVWIADERGRGLKQLSDADCTKGALVWAPDSKSLLWSGSDRKLRRVDIGNATTTEIASSEHGQISGVQFSPDANYISYSKPDRLLRSHVHIKELATGTERMLESDRFLTSTGAKWTPDGKKLLVIGGVGAPAMAALNRTSTQLYSIALTPVETRPDSRDIDTEEQAQSSSSDGARRGPGGPAAQAPKVEVKIDWNGMERRFQQISRSSDSVIAIVPSPDSRTYAFVTIGGGEEGFSGPALYIIGEDGSRLTRISTDAGRESSEGPRGRGGFGGGGLDPQWSRDGRNIYYMQGGGLYSVAVPAAPAADSGPSAASTPRGGGGRFPGAPAAPSAAPASSTPRRVAFTIRMEIDHASQRRQVFEEAWRVMKYRFYDPAMHGVNWAAMKDTYQPLLAHVGDSDELRSVIMQMIGELNASHTGVTGPGGPGGGGAQTRYPGFTLDPDPSGYFRVGHIYKRGPADHDYVKIEPGHYILSLNGKPLKTTENYWRHFNLLTGRKFEFQVNSKPHQEGSWTVSLEPLSGSAHADLEYERWVESRKQMVDKLSGGKIGYLHIRAMDSPSLRRFQRDLLDNQYKKALVIDQRFNGGGGIDQELLQILGQRTAYQTYRGRDSVELPRPVQAFYGPMVVMQNERSASNAEMFPDGFRRLGLGKVIGVPTSGAVIGTGSYRLLDGSSIRTPGVGVYTSKGENMENYGVPPDVYIDNTPADFLAGHDRQIEKAVEVLTAELGTK
ncbi:MAG: biopolymer transporter Tol [Acidimicrobiia bacterium]|nr:biopolymer transporter Tol [Acidimicrobiia bacterium]